MQGNNSRVKSFYIASIEFLWGSLTVHQVGRKCFRQDMSVFRGLPIISYFVLNDLTKIYKKLYRLNGAVVLTPIPIYKYPHVALETQVWLSLYTILLLNRWQI